MACKVHLDNINNIITDNEITEKELEKIKNTINFENRNIGHRESPRNIEEVTDLKEYIKYIQGTLKNIEEALKKDILNVKLPVYSIVSPEHKLMICEIDATKLIKETKTLQLYRINLNPKTNMIAFSNIIFFNNRNKTLPFGMDYSTEVLIDLRNVELKNKTTKENYIVKLSDNSKQITATKINITEFDTE